MKILKFKNKRRNELKDLLTIILIFSTLSISCNKQKLEENPNVFYTCSMDPQVMEKKPGNCPICKMELTKTVISPKEDKESIKLSETQIKLGNIKTQKVTFGSVEEGLNLRGNIVPDERKITVVSSRLPGRIDKLYFKNQGERINVGDRVYAIYSEELQASIQQYLLVKDKARQLNDSSINYSDMLKSAKDKLIVWGMSEKQIHNLTLNNSNNLVPFYSRVNGVVNEVPINEGDYVNEGASILKVADYSALWIEVEAYPQDMKAIKPGLNVTIVVEAYPNEVIEGQISFENPALEKQSRINLVRIEIPNKEGKYKPGMRVMVKALLKESTSLVIPTEAILYQTEMKTVWVVKDQGSFIPKMVETGIISNGNVEIKSGLKEGEEVVISGAYLIDSEYRLRKGSGDMPGMDNGNKKEETETPGHQH